MDYAAKMRKFLAILHTGNLEFFRDRAALSWNLLFPVMLVIGFTFAFSNDDRPLYKIGVMGDDSAATTDSAFLKLRYIDHVSYTNLESALEKLRYHQVDLLISPQQPPRYWVNEESPRGYVVERMLLSAESDHYSREAVTGRPVRYVDWVLPGILGMNMMFSSLFGVGYVIVRYRKNGVLKRLKATPLTAFEFLTAQIISRLLIIQALTMAIFAGCAWVIDIPVRGSYATLMLIALIGTMSLIALGLLIAARTSSEELAGGLLNMISWPMMFLSGVWFSLEGTPEILQAISLALPLTHLIAAAREVMINGAGLLEVGPQLLSMLGMAALFLVIGSLAFRWND